MNMLYALWVLVLAPYVFLYFFIGGIIMSSIYKGCNAFVGGLIMIFWPIFVPMFIKSWRDVNECK